MNSTKNIRQIRQAGQSHHISLPRDITEPLGMFSGRFVAVEPVGPVLVVFPLQNVQDVPGEFRAAFEKAISAFVARKGKAATDRERTALEGTAADRSRKGP